VGFCLFFPLFCHFLHFFYTLKRNYFISLQEKENKRKSDFYKS
jgi:hypothetical protein